MAAHVSTPVRLCGIVAALVTALPAVASTPAAIDQGLRDANRACLKAANLNKSAVVGSPVMFSDTTAQTLVIVRGNWKPRHMKGGAATMVCLYDRRARTAEAQEATAPLPR